MTKRPYTIIRGGKLIDLAKRKAVPVDILIKGDTIAEIGRHCHDRGILFHTDAAQAVGKIPIDVRRDGEQDSMTLMAEVENPREGLAAAVRETLRALTKLRGEVRFAAPGALPNDGKTIADERSTP